MTPFPNIDYSKPWYWCEHHIGPQGQGAQGCTMRPDLHRECALEGPFLTWREASRRGPRQAREKQS